MRFRQVKKEETTLFLQLFLLFSCAFCSLLRIKLDVDANPCEDNVNASDKVIFRKIAQAQMGLHFFLPAKTLLSS